MIIRPERQQDWQQIDAVNQAAFKSEFEPRLVNALRKSPAFIPELSLVAVDGSEIIGHILFIRLVVRNGEQDHTALGLAPLAVVPDRQRQGVGGQLVRGGFEQCTRLGHRLVFVVGHPRYYPRFGFTPARARGFEVGFPVPDEAFMVAELVDGALEGVSGMVKHPIELNT